MWFSYMFCSVIFFGLSLTIKIPDHSQIHIIHYQARIYKKGGSLPQSKKSVGEGAAKKFPRASRTSPSATPPPPNDRLNQRLHYYNVRIYTIFPQPWLLKRFSDLNEFHFHMLAVDCRVRKISAPLNRSSSFFHSSPDPTLPHLPLQGSIIQIVHSFTF